MNTTSKKKIISIILKKVTYPKNVKELIKILFHAVVKAMYVICTVIVIHLFLPWLLVLRPHLIQQWGLFSYIASSQLETIAGHSYFVVLCFLTNNTITNI